MKHLNIFELQNTISRKKQHRTNIYESVLHKCHIKIKSAANQERYECIFDVPNYVVGLPLFNINECIDFILNQLTDNGFKVYYHFPKLLHITWYPQKEGLLEHKPSPGSSTISSVINNEDPALLLHYIPYKNDKGKFTLNID